ncbi:hypothetical protein B0H17DRAFT_1131090 [Mycena rosella]|uniref:DNA 3'-5' helicase n=1 Tax=Mycena rosella TaxID=1033263 RepID=A0AAD7DR15_MYCRO|nr:hypothetical protein B0H17DRAFT_1131090 [Mycena rosella]
MKEDCQKIVLVVGPLVALMEARKLNEKGVPAAVITSRSPNVDQLMTDLGSSMLVLWNQKWGSAQFHENEHYLSGNQQAPLYMRVGNKDFRPEYRELVKLAARLPTGLPILGATATAPYHVIKDILANLGLPADCARVQVSNEKLNISLAVRVLQHELDLFADLLLLFPANAQGPEDFLIYTNGCLDAKKIQDFLRDNTPEASTGPKHSSSITAILRRPERTRSKSA